MDVKGFLQNTGRQAMEDYENSSMDLADKIDAKID